MNSCPFLSLHLSLHAATLNLPPELKGVLMVAALALCAWVLIRHTA